MRILDELQRIGLVSFALLAVAAAAGAATPPPLLTIPFRAVGSTVLLPVSVNGSERGWFILDSGANSCVIDKNFARIVGLHPATGGHASGAGKGAVPYERYRENVRFNVGGLPLECLGHVIGLDLREQPKIIGAKIAGILGTDFFASYVIEIDYARRVVRAFEPNGFRYTGPASRQPLMIDDRRLPHIDVVLTVDGSNTAVRRLLVDSGSQDAVDDDWISRSHDLRIATGGVGIGQTFEVQLGRFSEVQIGPFKLTDVPGAAGGVALIGGEALRHFTLIFDWPRKHLILEPSAAFARSLADSGVVGFGLRANDDGSATVDSVGAGTPAARGGFVAGDVVTGVDGTAASKFEFTQLQELFRRNRSYRIDIVRRGQRLTLRLDL